MADLTQSIPTLEVLPDSPKNPGAQPPFEAAAEARRATRIYGSGSTQVTALDAVSVRLPKQQFTAIMGPSGSGKSTLMHCLAGLDTLTSGEVSIGGTDLSTMTDTQLTRMRREKIGFVFQAFNLIPTLTAWENIVLPLDLAGAKVDADWVNTVVRAVGLGDRLGHKPDELSGGQQQRVAVSRALASRPDIIFADEPTGNLDSTTGEGILRFMRRAVDEFGQSIVMVTHDPVAAAWADQVLFLADGNIVDQMANPTADRILDQMRALTSTEGEV